MDIDDRLAAVAEREGIGTIWLTDDEGETRTIGKDLLVPLLEAYERGCKCTVCGYDIGEYAREATRCGACTDLYGDPGRG